MVTPAVEHDPESVPSASHPYNQYPVINLDVILYSSISTGQFSTGFPITNLYLFPLLDFSVLKIRSAHYVACMCH